MSNQERMTLFGKMRPEEIDVLEAHPTVAFGTLVYYPKGQKNITACFNDLLKPLGGVVVMDAQLDSVALVISTYAGLRAIAPHVEDISLSPDDKPRGAPETEKYFYFTYSDPLKRVRSQEKIPVV